MQAVYQEPSESISVKDKKDSGDNKLMKEQKSRFLRVKCSDCGNEQVIFGCASTDVKCLVCDKTLAKHRGGKAIIKTQILTVLDKDL